MVHLKRFVRVAIVFAAMISSGQAIGAPSDPRSGSSPTCEELADRIASSHPGLRAARYRAAAADSRSHAESSLPPPMASLEVWDFPIGAPSRADSEGMYMVGLGQEFPGGGRAERSRAEREMAHEARAEGDELGRRLRAEAAHACVAWSVAETVHARLLDHRRLLEQARDAALVSYRGSASGLGVVARADVELASAERRVAEIEAELETARATLAAFADKDVKLPNAAPLLSSRERDVGGAAVAGVTTRGDVNAARARQAAAAARLEAASSEASAPSFEVRATYMQAPGERPGLGAMVGMSLPWLWGGGGERETGARHDLEAAAAEADAARRAARVEVVQAAGKVRALRRALAVLQERELPAAERAVAAERASLGSGGFDLAAWLQAAAALRVARVDEARMLGDIEHAVVDLDASVGKPLTGASRREEPKR